MIDVWTEADLAALAALQRALARGDLAGALLAIEGAPPDRAEVARATLQSWGRRVAERPLAGARAQHEALRAVLVDALDVQGDAERYDDARNSFLTATLDRRRGLPILLSAVWMLVGEAAGVPVAGVGLPFHFIVRVGDDAPLFADPFHGGRVLSREDCRALVGKLSGDQLAWQEEFLAPAPMQAIGERVLRNLANHYDRTGRPEPQYRTARFLAALRPFDPAAQMLHARAADHVGARTLARSLYADVIERFADSREATWARRRSEELDRTPHVLH
jgi:regulator of sirC expression with transglutaminase-like and TPR domain